MLNRLPDGLNPLCFLVGDVDGKFLLDSHDQLDAIKTICAQIFLNV